jgi:arylsulfatase A-like enzyme
MKALVIAVSGFHLGYLGCYGNEWIATPALDRIAAEGIVFDQHYADRPDAPGAWHAWRTGRYGLPTADEPPPSAPEPDLLHLLRARGVRTRLVCDPHFNAPDDALSGWDEVRRVRDDKCNEQPAQTVQTTLEALDGGAEGGDVLVWVSLSTLLPPWDSASADHEDGDPLPVGPGHASDVAAFRRLQDAYAQCVTRLDEAIGVLLEEEIDRRGEAGRILVALTADCGLALHQHGLVGALPHCLHDEVIHIPLILRLPDRAEAGRRVFGLTQSVDLAPTLLEAFGAPVPDAVHGRSLWPLIRGQAREIRAYACAGLQAGEAVEWALRTPDWGFVYPVRPAAGKPPRSPQLHVKPDDRWEVNNVLQHRLELAEHFEQALRDFVKATRQPGPLHAPALRNVEAPLLTTGGEQA